MITTQDALPCIEIAPKQSARYTVIWLHGLGADGNDFAPIVPELNLPDTLPIRFIFPHAPILPITINHGYQMRAWYDMVSLDAENHMDEKGMLDSKLRIEQLIKRECSHGIKSHNILIAGFSQGAVMAFLIGLSYELPLAGILALSGYLPFSKELLKNATFDKKSMPIFIGHGKHDPIVPYSLSDKACAELKASGFNAALHSYNMPHSVCAEELQDISKWLQMAFHTETS